MSSTSDDIRVIDLVTNLSEIPKIQGGLDAFVDAGQLSTKVSMNVMLALEELFTNIVMYAHSDSELHDVRLSMRIDNDAVECELVDDGQPFDPTSEVPRVDTESSLEGRAIGGLGLHFVHSFMDDVSYSHEDGKNRVVVRKKLG